MRHYVAELKSERTPLHCVLVSVGKAVRDGAGVAAPALPWRDADALTAEVVQVAVDAYHTVV